VNRGVVQDDGQEHAHVSEQALNFSHAPHGKRIV
jgi:hypothetical protein